MKKTMYKTEAFIVLVIAGFILSAGNTFGEPKEGAVGRIKADFDTAMTQSSENRVTVLEGLEKQIDDAIFQGNVSHKDRALGYYYKFHVQQQLAKYPESHRTFSDYIGAIRDSEGSIAAESVLLRNITTWKRSGNHAECAAICETLIAEIGDDADVVPTAIYHEAMAKFRMNGTAKQSVSLCKKLIAEYPDSPWRPEAMRLLTNVYIALGNTKAAISTLELLKQQYHGTHWEHYADMRPAMILEYCKGDPQQALQIYQQSLVRYEDHLYGPYIHKQIGRLQKVVEQQLIQDALDGLVKHDAPDCHQKSVIVKSATDKNDVIAANL